jgi:hypothetical protein
VLPRSKDRFTQQEEYALLLDLSIAILGTRQTSFKMSSFSLGKKVLAWYAKGAWFAVEEGVVIQAAAKVAAGGREPG